jgi:hypothetical protein
VALRISDGRGKVLRSRALGWQTTGEGRDAAHTWSLRVDLPRGTYSVRALAADRAGNSQSRSVTGKLRVR